MAIISNTTKANLFLKAFGLTKVPMIGHCKTTVEDIDEEKVVIKIPLIRRTKNHLNSLYFGVLAVGADVAGGTLAMMKIEASKKKVALVFKDFHADFLKRAEADTYFTCSDGKKITEAVSETIKTGERVNIPVKVIATTPSVTADKPIAEFTLTLSMKYKP